MTAPARRDPRPPRLAGRLLDAVDSTGAIRGDLDEEFERHVVPQRGRVAAAAWYWRQTLGSLPQLLGTGRRREPGSEWWFTRRLTDTRAAVKAVTRRPGYASLAIATFALAMGTNTAVFSVVHNVLLKDLPYAEGDRMVRINPDQLFYTGLTDARRFSERATVFDRVDAWGRTLLTFIADGEGEEVRGAAVEWHHFDTLGVRPLVGRTFLPDDASASDTPLVLSYQLWQRRFGGDRSIVGQSVALSGGTGTVIGVLQADHMPIEPDWLVWTVLPADATQSQNPLAMNARLRPGATLPQALVATRSAYAAMGLEDGSPLTEEDLSAITVIPLREHLLGDMSRPLLILLGAVVFILLLACGNVMNLLLAQGTARDAEFALRLALGASRGRVFGQFMTEVMVVAGVGAINGLWLAWVILGWASTRLPADVPRTSGIGFGVTVFAYSAVAMLIAGLLAGLIPALRLSRRSLGASIGSATTRVSGESRRLSSGLIAAEVTLSIMLVIGAGLMIRSVVALRSVDPGFDTSRTVAVRIAPPAGRYPDGASLDGFYARIREEAMRSPLIDEAGGIVFLPMTPGGAWSRYQVEGAAPTTAERPQTGFRAITAGYLEAMGVALRAGRTISPDDRTDTEGVGVINETLAHEAFAGADPVGRVLLLGSGEEQTVVRVVGVVADVRQSDLRTDTHPEVYLPESQVGFPRMYMVARSARPNVDLNQALGALQTAVHTVDPGALVSRSMRVADVVATSRGQTQFIAEVLGFFGGVALLLGGVGVYGVTAHAVARRRREIGIRMALGADRGAVAWHTFLGGMTPIGLGVIGGLGLAVLGSQVLASMLFGISATDPFTLAVAPMLLVLTGTLALAVPALRASRVDPVRSLRDP